jgi:hypothetical protein
MNKMIAQWLLNDLTQIVCRLLIQLVLQPKYPIRALHKWFLILAESLMLSIRFYMALYTICNIQCSVSIYFPTLIGKYTYAKHWNKQEYLWLLHDISYYRIRCRRWSWCSQTTYIKRDSFSCSGVYRSYRLICLSILTTFTCASTPAVITRDNAAE